MAEPTRVDDLHLDAPILPLADARHTRARLLVRLHTRPLGEVSVPLRDGRLPATELAAAVWHQLGERIGEHLAADGLPVAAALPLTGLAQVPAPRCLDSRRGERPSMTVVIATRDRTLSLLRCLGSLADVDYPAFDVVVVDSAPTTTATAEVLERSEWAFPVRYVRTDRPGLAVAHNAGLPAVTGDVAAFTDDDVQVDRHWLSALADGFRLPAVQCVTGLILPAELETAAQQWIEDAGGFGRGYVPTVFGLSDPPDDPLFPFTAGRFGSGANMAFRTAWLRANGGFDAATGAGTPARGGDDLVAFLRVLVTGGRLAYEPAAIVRHYHRRDYPALRRQAWGYGVGLGAYLTAAALARPSLLRDMAARSVPAARHLLGAGSPKNRGKGSDYPAELTWRERAGVLAGPFAYALSRRRVRG